MSQHAWLDNRFPFISSFIDNLMTFFLMKSFIQVLFLKIQNIVGNHKTWSTACNTAQDSNVVTRPLEQGGAEWPCRPPPPPIFFSKVKVPFFNNHVNTFYLAWHKVKSCFRCIPSKIMIKFACSVMWVIVYHDVLCVMYVCELFRCSLISNRTILWIILAKILSTAFVFIHGNECTSSLMIFLKSCV